jgi:hypothetical protein
MVMLVRPVQLVNAKDPMLVTLLLLAKMTEVVVVWLFCQADGILPVIVEPT